MRGLLAACTVLWFGSLILDWLRLKPMDGFAPTGIAAQRIRDRVAGVRVDGFGASIRLTCSIGVAASDTLGVWGEYLIAQADAAVDRAKRLGRNLVQMAAPAAA